MKNVKNIVRIMFCGYIAAVLYLCFTQGEQLPDMPALWFGLPSDKVAHFIMFLPFVPLAYLAFVPFRAAIWKKISLIVIFAAVGFGLAAATEEIQGLLGYRAKDVKDMAADSLGLAAGTLLAVVTMTIDTLRKR